MREKSAGESIQPSVEIRETVPEDAAKICRLYKETWLATYPNKAAGISYEDVLDKVKDWDKPAYVEDTAKHIQTADSAHVKNLVAVSNGKIIGNTRVYKDRENDMFQGQPCNKLQTIYVLPEHHGSGVAQKLFDQAIDWLGNEKPIVLEVASYNERAKAFYEKNGFKVAGPAHRHEEITLLCDGRNIPEILMVRSP